MENENKVMEKDLVEVRKNEENLKIKVDIMKKINLDLENVNGNF